jgi:photosynthetic reaction center cytochrome c subunit
MRRLASGVVCSIGVLAAAAAAGPQDPAHPAVGTVDVPTVKILRGLTVPEFEAEMQRMNEALGVACGHCHVRGDFASDENPRKAAARRMLEMTRTINRQFFPDFQPEPGASLLGRVTCFTCHQGEQKPKAPPL